ncbi:hypothetical protein ABZ897_33255 [Nonomuraea sp. NPDC046802]|uniref:hypothetical protein n=1 Tax=Nonomuraea sp. NPDC046802 TaxID=3154919 RepID=UPI0033D5D9F1
MERSRQFGRVFGGHHGDAGVGAGRERPRPGASCGGVESRIHVQASRQDDGVDRVDDHGAVVLCRRDDTRADTDDHASAGDIGRRSWAPPIEA